MVSSKAKMVSIVFRAESSRVPPNGTGLLGPTNFQASNHNETRLRAERHGGQISNQSRATPNRVSDATTRILKVSDQRLAREIDRLQHEIQKIGP
jgi:hypothetical protein